jgi:TonB family protein
VNGGTSGAEAGPEWREPPDIGYALGVAPSKAKLAEFLALTAGLACAAGCASTPKSTCPTPDVAERWKADASPYKEYFAAIRKAAAAEWVPHMEGLATTGLFEVGKCRHTTLQVTTDADGAVVDQRVCRLSDSIVLDDTAMTAMRAAKSFGPVPPGLLSPDGRFRFTFSFFLYCRNVDTF